MLLMKITELNESLRKNVSAKCRYGVTKINHPEYKNLYFVVPPPPPKKFTNDKLPIKLISEANKIIHSLPQLNEMTEIDKLINYLFIRKEAVQSSRFEGTWSTIDHVLSIATEEKNLIEKKNEHIAVRSYATVLEKFLELAFQKKEKIFSLNTIAEIQKKIVENDPNSQGHPGKIRIPGQSGSIVTIGGLHRKEDSIYNPPPPEFVEKCLNEFIEIISDEELSRLGDTGFGNSLSVRMAIYHAHFEAIHPFTDGNGRTGRSLWPLQMSAAGFMPLYLSGYVEEKKVKYIKALEEAQKKLNYIPIVEFICKAIIESSLELEESKKSINILKAEWISRGQFKSNSAARNSIEILFSSPIINTTILKNRLNISMPASTNAINQLVKAKIIKKRGYENKSAVYAAEEIIALLSRPFGSDIEFALAKARKLLES
jgi:Fic family protein